MMMMKLCSVLWITWTALDCTVFFNISTSSIKGPSVSISTGLFSPDGSTYKTHYSGKESNRNTDRNMSVKEPLAADGMKQTDVSRNSCRSERNRVTWLTGSSTTKRSDPDHVMHDWIQKLTCGFDLARFSIFIQASSRSFSLAFSLEAKAVFSSGTIHHMTPQLCLCLDSLVLLGSELLCAVVKQLLVHLHEELQCVIDQTVNGPTVINTHIFMCYERHQHSERTETLTETPRHLYISIKHCLACWFDANRRESYLFQWLLELR